MMEMEKYLETIEEVIAKKANIRIPGNLFNSIEYLTGMKM